MSTSTRWTIAVLAVLALLIAAMVAAMDDKPTPEGAQASQLSGPGRAHREADTAAALAEPRQRARLSPCPAGADNPGPPKLRGVVVECAADGASVDVGRILAGRPVVLNLWAYWCGPCQQELPAMADYQRRMGSEVMVVTVHQDENEEAALMRLAELGVHLPTLQDGQRTIAAALGVPNVMPATVVLRADGTVAEILPRAFANADEIAAAVGDDLR
jgi:thiol-disulfide isomerase/thioredoxin